jgi:hypothetical protein
MMRSLIIAVVAALLVAGNPASAEEHTRKRAHAAKKDKDKKAETGASCKAPAVGACASCAITCRPGETATCGPGMTSGDLCARPPSCTCK